MKNQDLIRLEAAMRDANPIPRPEDLIDSPEAGAVAVLVRAGTETASPAPVLDDSNRVLDEPAPRRRAWAFAAGLAVAVLVIGAVVLLRPGTLPGPDPATTLPPTTTSLPTTSTTTTTVATTTPDTTLPEPVALDSFVFPADDVPAFTATIVYDMNPLGTDEWIPAEATMTVQVLFNSPEDYLYEVVSAEPAGGVMDAFGPAGLSILGAGDQAWIKEPGDAAAFPAENFGPARHLLWNSRYPAWDETCSSGEFTALGTATVAGRVTTHGRCSTVAENYELWVDNETGVVMKLRGAMVLGDFMPATAGGGGFEIVEFALGEVELPSPLSPPSSSGDMPPLHAVVVEQNGDGVSTTREVWYLDEETWIERTVQSTDEETVKGSFVLRADGRFRGCEPPGPFNGGSCRDIPYLVPNDWVAVGVAPDAAFEEHCDFVDVEAVLGRPANHYVCAVRLGAPDWVPIGNDDPPAHHWIDQETSIHLRYESANRQTWLSLLEINPLFPPEVFDPVPPPGTNRHGEECLLDDPDCQFWTNSLLEWGEAPPSFTGPFLDGATFRLEDLRGRPAVIFRWVDAFAPEVLEQHLDDFQALADKWGDRVEFVAASEMGVEFAEQVMARGGYTFRSVECFGQGPEGTIYLCDPADGARLWKTPRLSWVILDEDGNVFDGFGIYRGTYAEIDAALEEVLGA